MLKDMVGLVYPELCEACERDLSGGEKTICTKCRFHLPKTNFHLLDENPVSKKFWGKAELEFASSFYLFNKGTKVQRLIHKLKYQGKRVIGESIGNLYGHELLQTEKLKDVDVVVAVPLHPAKLMKRGYNQSEYIAKGVSAALSKPSDFKIIFRTAHSDTQTKKSRFARWENVEKIFTVKNPEMIKGKHVLLVDDVITTGSTMEACIRELMSAGARVSIITLACTP